MNGQDQIAQLRRSVVAACRAAGLEEKDIHFTRSGFEIPDEGLKVSLALSEGRRVWSVVETFVVDALDGTGDRHYSTILFEESLGSELFLAKKVAMKIAENRIDAAIDAAASG